MGKIICGLSGPGSAGDCESEASYYYFTPTSDILGDDKKVIAICEDHKLYMNMKFISKFHDMRPITKNQYIKYMVIE